MAEPFKEALAICLVLVRRPFSSCGDVSECPARRFEASSNFAIVRNLRESEIKRRAEHPTSSGSPTAPAPYFVPF
ncbi:hypothetical protein FHT97_002844 [Rhizobium sp. BK399]|nr:hypothetical protein [Rhizobium sp. BK399]